MSTKMGLRKEFSYSRQRARNNVLKWKRRKSAEGEGLVGVASSNTALP